MKICHWLLLLLGLWILVSPWALGFSSFNTAMWSNVAAGVLVIVCALWELFGNSGKPAESTNPNQPQQ